MIKAMQLLFGSPQKEARDKIDAATSGLLDTLQKIEGNKNRKKTEQKRAILNGHKADGLAVVSGIKVGG